MKTNSKNVFPLLLWRFFWLLMIAGVAIMIYVVYDSLVKCGLL